MDNNKPIKHKAKLVSVLTEKVFEDDILNILKEEGAKGYSIFEGGGSGSFHQHQSQKLSLVDEFRIVKIETVVGKAAVADRIAERIMTECFVDEPGVVHLSDVEIFRSQKF